MALNLEAIQRLIDNLEFQPIEHDQCIWLQDHDDLIVLSDTNRWTCATSGCAAGFTFLAEAPAGSVFDTHSAHVFSSMSDALTLNEPVAIDEWAARILGFRSQQADFVFQEGNDTTEETLSKIRWVVLNPDRDTDEYLGYDEDYDDI